MYSHGYFNHREDAFLERDSQQKIHISFISGDKKIFEKQEAI